jgi:hypothetical protein
MGNKRPVSHGANTRVGVLAHKNELSRFARLTGGLPSGITFWQGPPLPVTLRLIHPPPKMTQGVIIGPIAAGRPLGK